MVEFKNITKKYKNGDDLSAVIEGFSLTLSNGEKAVIMGESGSGKTTLLRIAAGLERPDGGEFSTDEKVAYMFQEPRLLPWFTALENVRAVLPKDQFSLADKYLWAVGLEDDSGKLPSELSGGMAQRVAFARFLAYAEASEATLLLLDEPFSALDSDTTEKMLALLKDFSKEKALMLVTHDSLEAKAFDQAEIIYL